ncbi:MAG: DUF1987 domain-containing protein [Flavobacteriales bacterium]|nr:DUF1987 domain-containing protein [Flavobacteriales bacterium]MCB9191426.1 DUF1987 domain-containing protein [Flavobacteriales bacterium]MCB9203948.1 DUF1987 domain-containing protein [Flavobacteriales bacterium]
MNIEATPYSPQIAYDEEKQVLRISGRSIPDNPVEFYHPIQQFVESLVERSDSLTIDVKLDYFNTSSSKQLLDLFGKMEEMAKAGKQVKVVWRYAEDDDDLKESGEDYMELVEVPFEMVVE